MNGGGGALHNFDSGEALGTISWENLTAATTTRGLTFDASRSNSIYKDNTHVIPNSIKCTFYIKA